jgi:SAM-dependent methyltransferase
MNLPKRDVATTSEVVTRRTACRGCGGTKLHSFLSLGEVPLANSFLSAAELIHPEPRFPLEVFFCQDCSLVQLQHVVKPEVLFSHYLYRTGTGQMITEHNKKLCDSVVAELQLGAKDLVVEIASNDGSLLSWFQKRGVRTLGVEPAKNIAQIAREAGIDTLNEFFDLAIAKRVIAERGQASAVIANNVLAHVDATVEFLSAARELLKPGGRVIIEVPYLGEMLDRLEYDTIYHEHLCYFSVTALVRVFAEAGLALDRVDHVPIHGGSLRLWGKCRDHGGHSESVRMMAEAEQQRGMRSLKLYQDFAAHVEQNRAALLALLERLRSEGKRIAGYGAPAKGNTLLCYCGIGVDLLPFTVDVSPLKVGLYTPGSRIPVLPVQEIFDQQPDFVLILAWNFAPEIMEFLRPFQEKGGRFILPIPEPKII